MKVIYDDTVAPCRAPPRDVPFSIGASHLHFAAPVDFVFNAFVAAAAVADVAVPRFQVIVSTRL